MENYAFYNRLTIIIIFNIDPTIIYTDLFHKIIALLFIAYIETKHLTTKRSNWLVTTTKRTNKKSHIAIINIMNDTSFSIEQTERPNRSNTFNISSHILSYTSILRQDDPHNYIQYAYSLKRAYIRYINILYNVDSDYRLFSTDKEQRPLLTEILMLHRYSIATTILLQHILLLTMHRPVLHLILTIISSNV